MWVGHLADRGRGADPPAGSQGAVWTVTGSGQVRMRGVVCVGWGGGRVELVVEHPINMRQGADPTPADSQSTLWTVTGS